MSNQTHIQIPPDSTGRRVRTSRRFDATVTNLRNISAQILESSTGETITGATSNATAILTGVRAESTITVFYLEHISGTFTAGEDLSFKGTVVATFQEGSYVDTQEVVLTSHNNPSHHLKVSRDGSAYIRFLEGNQTFGAFGVAETAPVQNLDEYTFQYTSQDGLFKIEETGGGSSSHSAQESTLRLITDTTAGARSARTTRRYFPYLPGQGSASIFSVALGDTGKENVRRRWGMFDDEDGVFFQEENGQLSVGIRSNTSGTPTDTIVPRDDFNGDKVESSDFSKFELQPDKMNIYWIDFQWLGAGRVRFGTYAPDGTRVTMHIFQNVGNNILPYMTRGTLPLKAEIENLATTASSSELKLVCMVAQRQCADKHHPGDGQQFRTDLKTLTDSNPVYLFSMRPTLLYNGVANKTQFIPGSTESYIKNGPIRLEVYLNATLTAPSFTQHNQVTGTSAVEIDTAATGISGGLLYDTMYLKSTDDLRELEQSVKKSIQLGLGGVEQPVFSFTATKMDSAASSAEIEFLFRWFEAR